MKTKILLVSFLALLLFSSCASRHLVFIDKPSRVDLKEELLYTDTRKPLSIDSFSLKRLITSDKELAAQPMLEVYIKKVLGEAKAKRDTILALSPDMVILKTSKKKSFKPDYVYTLDEAKKEFRGHLLRKSMEGREALEAEPQYYRKIYHLEKHHRVLVKDMIDDVTILYIIQGEISEFPYRRMLYNPAYFPNFSGTAAVIIGRINPMSERIKLHFNKE